MNQSPLADDIAFVRQMAEEGAAAPNVGGRFGVLWGSVISIALLLHWSTFQDWGLIDTPHLMYVWLAAISIGIIGHFVVSAGLSHKPGASAPGNRAGAAIWSIIGPGLGLYFAGVAAAVIFRDQSPTLFNMIMPSAFLAYGAAAGVSGALFKQRRQWLIAIICLAACFITLLLVNTSEAYLAAAAGVFLTQVIPGIADLRAEPKSVV